ncbi:hypothetical protein ACFL6S_12455 [Candidatus Poribacteria bacterium]
MSKASLYPILASVAWIMCHRTIQKAELAATICSGGTENGVFLTPRNA